MVFIGVTEGKASMRGTLEGFRYAVSTGYGAPGPGFMHDFEGLAP